MVQDLLALDGALRQPVLEHRAVLFAIWGAHGAAGADDALELRAGVVPEFAAFHLASNFVALRAQFVDPLLQLPSLLISV